MIERFAGRFVLLKRLGRGGMGSVFLARDEVTGAECALKRLETTAHMVAGDSARREFEALTRVRHPAVVAVRELGLAPEGGAFYTMEYVPGVAADRGLPRGDWGALAGFAAQVVHGLEALHAAGVVHGDLKPSNVLVLPDGGGPGSVRLVDFGLASLRGRADAGHCGTAGFAAPEVVRGDPPDAASDLYGLGALLYTLVSGRRPFDAEDISALLRSQQSGPPPAAPLEEAGLPPALVQLVLGLLAPEPRERPASARDVRLEIERLFPAARWPLAERLRAVRVVGRERELARVEAWLAAPRRRAAALWLVGEAGIGKSALLDELAVRAALAGRAVVRLSPVGADAPGGLARALLRRLAAEAGGDDGADDGARAWIAAEDGGPSEALLAALAARALGWADALARRDAGLLALIDDADRLDVASEALLRRLALQASPGLAMVWALSADGPATDARDALLAAGAAERLALGTLDDEGLARLAAARLGAPAPDVLLEFLARRCGGHPGLTVAMLTRAAESGGLRERDGVLLTDAGVLEGLATPDSFDASLLTHLGALPAGAREAAVALAVWDRPATRVELAALAPALGDGALDALLAAHLAARGEDGRWALRAGRLGPALRAALTAEERRTLHRAALAAGPLGARERFRHLRETGDVAAALAAATEAHAAHADPRLAAEAAVLAETTGATEAADWHARAGEALFARGRQAEAVPHLERALALDPTAESAPRRRVKLTTALLRAGRAAEMARVIEQGLAASPTPAIRARLMVDEAARRMNAGDAEGAERAAREALEHGEQAEDEGAMGAAAMTLAGLTHLRGEDDEARTLAERAERWCAQAGDVQNQTRSRGLRGQIAFAAGRLAEAERLTRSALEQARAHGVRLAEEEMLVNLAMLKSASGRWLEAREAYTAAARIGLEDGRAHSAILALNNLAVLDGLLGRPRAALRAARRARAFMRRRLVLYEPFAMRAQAAALRVGGRLRSAERAARRGLARAMRDRFVGESAWMRIELARVLAARGRWVACRGICEALDPVASPGVDAIALGILAALAGRAALRTRAADVARARLIEAERHLAGQTSPYGHAHVEQLRAELQLTDGRRAEGLETARRCLAAFASLPAPPDRAEAAFEFARLALAEDGEPPAPVAVWLEDAAALFQRHGHHRARERALELLVECQRRGAPPAAAKVHDRSLIEAVSRLLGSLSDPREVAQRAMAMAVEQLDAERGVLLLADPERGGELMPIAEHGAIDASTRREAMSYSRRVVARVAESGGSLLISDAPTDPRARSESVLGLRLRSILCVPMYLGGRVIGAVYLDHSRRADAFADAHRGVLEGFAHLMAVALEKSRGHDEVQRANEQLVGENLSLRQEVALRFQTHAVIGLSTPMQRVLSTVERAAATNATVLITGEHGTGKELIARVLHNSGRRRLGPFVMVNCGAIPEPLLESELFGILPNVATGVRGRDGRFVQADGGTLLLDEIGDMPPSQQVALLSVLQNREITPIGGHRPIPVDVRIIAATNQDLRRRIEDGHFRVDLFYRLNVIPIEVPPLREHKADIPALVHHFVTEFARQQERDAPELSSDFIPVLIESDWPGNVRELQNYIERVMAMTPGHVLHPNPLPRDLEGRDPVRPTSRHRRLTDQVEELERRLVREALERAKGNISQAARELGLPEQSMRYRVRKYGLDPTRRNRRPRQK